MLIYRRRELILWYAHGLLEAFVTVRAATARVPRLIAPAVGPHESVFARPTVSMEFTGRPTYAVVQQSGPARSGDRIIHWVDQHTGPITWQIRDRAGLVSATAILQFTPWFGVHPIPFPHAAGCVAEICSFARWSGCEWCFAVLDPLGDALGDAAPTATEPAMAGTVTPATVLTVRVVTGGVHGPEAGRGQCGEHLWMLGDGGGHVVVAAVETGVDQLCGVAGAQVRAGRARDRAAVVAAGQYLMLPAERVGTEQADRVGAERDVFGFLPPGLEAR